jgi:predicted ATPase/Tfp pilus assembly protein PilF
VQFNPQADVMLDVAQFMVLAEANKHHHHRRLSACRACIQRLEALTALYRGAFLSQFFLSDSDVFEEWALLRREWFHLQIVEALTILGRYTERRGDFAQALDYIRRQVTLEPWREEAHRHLMRLLARAGQRSAALMQYEKCRKALADELGVAPTAETTALYTAIRAGKSLSDVADEASGRQADGETLALSCQGFVGREKEIAELNDLLAAPNCRLVTLVGPGGIGKSCLALKVAAEQVGLFVDGVVSVSLTAVTTAALLPTVLVDALKVPGGSQTPRTHLLDFLREKELLLLLDNMEQLLGGADLIDDILTRAPGVTLLVTSRERLNLRQEWVYEVLGLTYPEPALSIEHRASSIEHHESPSSDYPSSIAYSAVALFIQRARQIRRDFAPEEHPAAIVRICQLVEGLPLAVELAAALVDVRSCETIADDIAQSLDALTTRWRNALPRHRSLRATFDHSWRLLTPEDRQLFQRLSLFRGGFSEAAAMLVAEARLTGLQSLIEKSLLRRDATGRYQIHELLRQYAEEQLPQSPAVYATVSAAHADYYAEFLEGQVAPLRDARQSQALNGIRTEIDNIRRAWDWALSRLAQGAAETAIPVLARALEGLYLYYITHDYYHEGEETFGLAAAALEAYSGATPAAPQHALLLGRLLARQGRCCEFTRRSDKARQLHERSLVLFRALGTEEARAEMALSLHGLGYIAHIQGEYAQARSYFEESLACYTANAAPWGVASVYNNLCLLGRREGDYEGALRWGEASLAIRREIGDRRGVASALNSLGLVYTAQGQYELAQAVLLESLEICRQLDHKVGVANALTTLGVTTFHLQETEAAVRFMQHSLDVYREIGDWWGVAIAYNNLGHIATETGDYAQARRMLEKGIEVFRDIGIKSGLANALNNLGEACAHLGESDVARQHFLEALRLADAVGEIPIVLEILARLATLLAQRGETPRALEILACVREHPATLDASRTQAAADFSTLAARLPAEQVTQCIRCGQALSLTDLVEALLKA